MFGIITGCNAAHLRGPAYPAQCDDIMTPLGGNLQTSAADWWTEDRGIFSTLAILHQIIVSFDSFIFFWVFILQNIYCKIIKYQNKRRLRVYYRSVAKTYAIILPNRASLNHIKPHYYMYKCVLKVYYRDFIFIRRSRVLKNFEAGKTNFIIRQTVAGPGPG